MTTQPKVRCVVGDGELDHAPPRAIRACTRRGRPSAPGLCPSRGRGYALMSAVPRAFRLRAARLRAAAAQQARLRCKSCLSEALCLGRS
jgi:hypothetical protein